MRKGVYRDTDRISQKVMDIINSQSKSVCFTGFSNKERRLIRRMVKEHNNKKSI